MLIYQDRQEVKNQPTDPISLTNKTFFFYTYNTCLVQWSYTFRDEAEKGYTLF